MKVARYLPLFILVCVAFLGAFALVLGHFLSLKDGMRLFMGLLFCQFAMLKLFSPSQFAKGFQMYDLFAKRAAIYAYLYPFIELGLGLAYLASWNLFAVNIVTIVVTSIGVIGVWQALKAGLNIRCACMGTVLTVPLSTVTLAEDLGMGIMALFMLIS